MSAQASLPRMCFRCRIQIFPSGFGQLGLPNCHLLRHTGSRYRGRSVIRAGVYQQFGYFSSKGLGPEKTSTEVGTVSKVQETPDDQQPESEVYIPKTAGSQWGGPTPSIADSIANLDAGLFLSTAKSREKKAVEARTDSPLLSPGAKKADKQFLKSYRVLLSDTRHDIEMELQSPGELGGISAKFVAAPEGLKRMAINRGNSSTSDTSWPIGLPPDLKGVASKCDLALPKGVGVSDSMKLIRLLVFFSPATHRVQDLDRSLVGHDVVMHGFLTAPRLINSKLMFVNFFDFHSGPGVSIQVVSNLFVDVSPDMVKAHETLSSLLPFTPVAISGKIVKRESTQRHKGELVESSGNIPKSLISREFRSRRPSDGVVLDNASTFLELHLATLNPLNSVSKDLIYTPSTVFPPQERHLQLRTNSFLFSALRLRAKAASICRDQLEKEGFLEVETPLLFKSTPEGAREFLVPTRSKENGGGMCYALPQSPQQYKQILMASGVARYFQLAKCFRDEDLRADRQPEFTQLDLEISFATGNEVMSVIENLLRRLWKEILHVELGGEFQRMTWWYAMKFYGTDKPDLRFPKGKINEISSLVPHLVNNKDEHIEAFSCSCERTTPPENVRELLQSFRAEFRGEGENSFLSYIAGDQPTMHGELEQAKIGEAEMARINKEIWALPGSIVVVKNRQGSWSGGNTKLGHLRTALINKARKLNFIRTPEKPEFVWIIDFPLFTPSSDAEPGQSGTAGLSSTHHPFTAPHPKDIGMLPSAPEKVRGEHYDIVVNGIELGGGSRRIHDAVLQRYILEKVLKIHPLRIHQFDHLLGVLNSGCPPHAGIALGFDRLIAVLQGTDSVRDVIAFPKSAKGADLLVGSPSLVSDEDLEVYHIRKIPAREKPAEAR